jgi:N-acetylmuramoyl-L-alanine amidase
MSDDFLNNKPPEDNSQDESSASAIFAEMMRQAAARRTPDDSQQESTPTVEIEETESQLPPTQDESTLADDLAELTSESLKSDTLQNEEKLAEAMERQKVMRVKRRRERRRRNTVGTIGGFLRTMFVVLLSAGLVATILTWFTDPQFLNPDVVKGLQGNRPALIADVTTAPTFQPTQISTPNWLQRVGVVAGHRGPENDPGAVCEDGLTEAEINFNVAQQIVSNLRALNYTVDLLDEFDPRLNDYQAAALISIHANTCQDFGEVVSGYLVAKAASRPDGGIDTILAECLAQKYENRVPLERRFSLTLDMTDYHTFREIHPLTPAAIVELGFMLADRELLTEQPELLAQALTEGVICFLQPSDDYPTLETPDAIPEDFAPIETVVAVTATP